MLSSHQMPLDLATPMAAVSPEAAAKWLLPVHMLLPPGGVHG